MDILEPDSLAERYIKNDINMDILEPNSLAEAYINKLLEKKIIYLIKTITRPLKQNLKKKHRSDYVKTF